MGLLKLTRYRYRSSQPTPVTLNRRYTATGRYEAVIPFLWLDLGQKTAPPIMKILSSSF